MKYIRNSLSFLLLFSFYSPIAQGSDFDDFDDFDELTSIIKSISDDDIRALQTTCEPGEAEDWVHYLSLLDIPKIFNEDFYNVTALPSDRNIINYPNFFIFSYQEPENQQITIHAFYNQCSKKSFTPDLEFECCNHKKHNVDGTTLGSYLNIENGTFFGVINNDLQTFGSLLPSDLDPLKQLHFPSIFKTIAQARLEERRVGVLAHYFKQISPKFSLEMRIPLLWQVKNLNFTDEEKDTLDRQFSAFQSEDFDEVEFGKQHVVMDAFGSGTLDLTLKYTVRSDDKFELQVGGTFYAPTDGRWSTGWYGTYFEPKDQQPILNLCEIVDIKDFTLASDAKDQVEQYFLGALDHLSSAILQCPLGYDKHLGLAIKVLPYWQFRPNIEYSGVYIFEYLLPREQLRFFTEEPETLFSEEFDKLADQKKYKEALTLLETQLTKRLYPRVFPTKVTPGFLFNTISNIQTSYKNWNFTVGYNWWYRTAEKLSDIQAPIDVLRELNINKATNDSASQIKLYGKVHRLFETSRHHHVSVSLYANATIYSYNIGNDFSVGISFDKVF